MSKFYLALVAAGLLAVSALPAAASGQKTEAGVMNSSVSSVELSARRYYRRSGYYRGGPYYRGYGYSPYYAYGPGPYYYGPPRYYNRPAFPFPFFPFF
jgi:hypothetical protein